MNHKESHEQSRYRDVEVGDVVIDADGMRIVKMKLGTTVYTTLMNGLEPKQIDLDPHAKR